MARARQHRKDSVSQAALPPTLSQYHQNDRVLCKRTVRYLRGDGGWGCHCCYLFLNNPLEACGPYRRAAINQIIQGRDLIQGAFSPGG